MAFLGIGKKKPILPSLSWNGSQPSIGSSSTPKPALSGTGTPNGTNSLIVSPKPSSAVTLGPGNGAPILPQGASVGSTNINLKPYAVPAPSNNATSLQVPAKPAAPTTSLSGTPTSQPAPSYASQGPSQPPYSQPSYSGGYTSTDPAVAARIKSMSDAAEASANAQRSPATYATSSPIARNDLVTKPTVSQVQPANPATLGASVIDQLRQKIGSLSAPSAEEQALEDELAKFRGDAKQSIAGLEGRVAGEPLGLVRGEQAKLTEQAALQEQTLMERLAAASAQRQAQLQAVQNEYNIAAAEQARQDQLTAPTAVGGSILQFDPVTGQYKTLYSAPPQATESPTSVQEFQFAQQQGFGGSYTDFLAQKAAYSQNPANLQFVAPTSTFGGGVFNPETGQFDAAPTAPKQVSQLTTDALGLIDQLVTHPGLRGATGGIRIALPGSEAANFNAQLDRLKSLLSLENISYLKGTGAMSDREFATLSSAAAALDPKMSSDAFLAELQRIQRDLQSEAGGGGDEIDQFLDSFSSAGRALSGTSAKAVAQNYPAGSNGGQCGRFVNRLTGLQMGNTYQSKMAYVDPSIKTPKPGYTFVMPYKQFGHTGIVADEPLRPQPDGSYDIPVVDSNWNLDEKVSHHYINSKQISGYVPTTPTSQRVSLA